MALMACPECGGKVSGKAFACPHCGYRLQLNEMERLAQSLENERKAEAAGQVIGAGLGCVGILLKVAISLVVLGVVFMFLGMVIGIISSAGKQADNAPRVEPASPPKAPVATPTPSPPVAPAVEIEEDLPTEEVAGHRLAARKKIFLEHNEALSAALLEARKQFPRGGSQTAFAALKRDEERDMMSRYGLDASQLKAIEDEGIKKQWPTRKQDVDDQ